MNKLWYLVLPSVLEGCSSVNEHDSTGIHETAQVILNNYEISYANGKTVIDDKTHWGGISTTTFYFSNTSQNVKKQFLGEISHYCTSVSRGTWDSNGGWCRDNKTYEPLFHVTALDYLRDIDPSESKPTYTLKVTVQTSTSPEDTQFMTAYRADFGRLERNATSRIAFEAKGHDLDGKPVMICKGKSGSKAYYGWAVGATDSEVALVYPGNPDAVIYDRNISEYKTCNVSEIAHDPSTNYSQILQQNKPDFTDKMMETIHYIHETELYTKVSEK
ncbi:hypothetical protein AB4383_03970 [Vibrio breoganii]